MCSRIRASSDCRESGLYDIAVVMRNDSDLVLSIAVVEAEFGKPLGVLNPHQKRRFRLRECASLYTPIRGCPMSQPGPDHT